ncbi:hypothetical protein GH714_021622 [Hevea brasiliensis]|uniref:Retrotransposon gag domain-containing protein n=1 Tax=Hevea brasiliensis TaxID=3981 RepID=A0A6A6M8I7_HEVBR|nr:hypothetical protein GH714_021622 [Hevea brasiliensis]
MGKQTIMEEESVKQHLRSPHSIEFAPVTIYTLGTQNASYRGSNIAIKKVRFNPIGIIPLHFEERTHISYDEHVLNAPPNIHFRQDPHFEHYDPHSRAFDRNYRQPDPHGRLFDRDHRQPPRYANNEHVDIIRKVKLNAPEYDGKLDPNIFIDWLDGLKAYCDFYHMTDLEHVHFAKIKLIGATRKYWQSVQCNMKRLNEPPITQWAVMKSKLKEKYAPSYYEDNLVHELRTLSLYFISLLVY